MTLITCQNGWEQHTHAYKYMHRQRDRANFRTSSTDKSEGGVAVPSGPPGASFTARINTGQVYIHGGPPAAAVDKAGRSCWQTKERQCSPLGLRKQPCQQSPPVDPSTLKGWSGSPLSLPWCPYMYFHGPLADSSIQARTINSFVSKSKDLSRAGHNAQFNS